MVKMQSGVRKIRQFVVLPLIAGLLLLFGEPLPAGSRLGKITGIMDKIVAINLGSIHGVRQGLRGTVFRFDQSKNTVNVAEIQVIGVSDTSCLAKVTALMDTLELEQFVDIEGTLSPQILEKVDVVREMEENARNYFAVRQYTEPDSANCLAECRKILERDPGNRLALEMKRVMIRDYMSWAERELNQGNFAYAFIYCDRILKIDPNEPQAFEKIFELIDLMDVESGIPLDPISGGRPPDFYYAIALQYYRQGQFAKSNVYYNYLLDNFVKNDPAALEGRQKNDKMLALVGRLRQMRVSQASQRAEVEQKRREEQQQRKKKIEQARYFRVAAEDLFRKKDFTAALVYYLKIMDISPEDSLVQQRREVIAQYDMVKIPAGEFSRGSSDREIGEIKVDFGSNTMLNRELPKQWVYLDSFYIDRHEVTNHEYKSFIESTDHSPPLNWTDGTYPAGMDDYPVVYVSWLDASAYARWIGKRLPTEQEWEKAARGSNGYQWPWGDRFYPHRCNVKETGKNGPLPVGSFLNGANEFGVLDLAGNVWEWINTDIGPYSGYADDPSYFPSRFRKVIRGGSFMSSGACARGAFRGDAAVNQLYIDVGFRCARDAGTVVDVPDS